MTHSLDQALRAFNPALPLAVALSGGADSVALLVACADKWPGQVVALHVNHGLQVAATQFEALCVALCHQLKVPLRIQTVDAKHQPGQSPEDAARVARYQALAHLAQDPGLPGAIRSIAIAQHADDQMETVLLALSRGAGLAGLSAMPAQWQRDGLDYYRPLLGVAGADIRRWLQQRGIAYVEDPTNEDQRYTRNRIRAKCMPALCAVFPHALDTFARSAAHAAQAQTLLDEVAAQDLQTAVGGNQTKVRGDHMTTPSDDMLLCIKAVQGLSPARQSNLLRYWLKQQFKVVPSTAQLAELVAQVADCRTRGHRIHIKVGPGFVQRRGDALTWYNP